ncbi:MAG: helix-turn-helix domain-containing protein [Minisyncoccia bacterium]
MKKDELMGRIERYRDEGNILEAFVLQSAYIESLIKLFADIKLRISIKTSEPKVIQSLKTKTDNYSLNELTKFLISCGWLPSEKKSLLDRYRTKRNKVLHDLLRQIRTKDFENEMQEVYKDGVEIISLTEFSVTDQFFGLIEKQSDGVIKHHQSNTNQITERENEILTLRFQGRTYDTIAKKYGLTRERIRQLLNGALLKVLAAPVATLIHPVVTPVHIEVKKMRKLAPYSEVAVQNLISSVCLTYGISNEELVGKSRRAHLVFPRHIAMYLMRKKLRLSFPRIGAILGGRDHTTIVHAYHKIENLIKKEKISV